MLCKDVMYEIEKEYPLNYALSWDNVGLLVGRDDKEVKLIVLNGVSKRKIIGKMSGIREGGNK